MGSGITITPLTGFGMDDIKTVYLALSTFEAQITFGDYRSMNMVVDEEGHSSPDRWEYETQDTDHDSIFNSILLLNDQTQVLAYATLDPQRLDTVHKWYVSISIETSAGEASQYAIVLDSVYNQHALDTSVSSDLGEEHQLNAVHTDLQYGSAFNSVNTLNLGYTLNQSALAVQPVLIESDAVPFEQLVIPGEDAADINKSLVHLHLLKGSPDRHYYFYEHKDLNTVSEKGFTHNSFDSNTKVRSFMTTSLGAYNTPALVKYLVYSVVGPGLDITDLADCYRYGSIFFNGEKNFGFFLPLIKYSGNSKDIIGCVLIPSGAYQSIVHYEFDNNIPIDEDNNFIPNYYRYESVNIIQLGANKSIVWNDAEPDSLPNPIAEQDGSHNNSYSGFENAWLINRMTESFSWVLDHEETYTDPDTGDEHTKYFYNEMMTRQDTDGYYSATTVPTGNTEIIIDSNVPPEPAPEESYILRGSDSTYDYKIYKKTAAVTIEDSVCMSPSLCQFGYYLSLTEGAPSDIESFMHYCIDTKKTFTNYLETNYEQSRPISIPRNYVSVTLFKALQLAYNNWRADNPDSTSFAWTEDTNNVTVIILSLTHASQFMETTYTTDLQALIDEVLDFDQLLTSYKQTENPPADTSKQDLFLNFINEYGSETQTLAKLDAISENHTNYIDKIPDPPVAAHDNFSSYSLNPDISYFYKAIASEAKTIGLAETDAFNKFLGKGKYDQYMMSDNAVIGITKEEPTEDKPGYYYVTVMKYTGKQDNRFFRHAIPMNTVHSLLVSYSTNILTYRMRIGTGNALYTSIYDLNSDNPYVPILSNEDIFDTRLLPTNESIVEISTLYYANGLLFSTEYDLDADQNTLIENNLGLYIKTSGKKLNRRVFYEEV